MAADDVAFDLVEMIAKSGVAKAPSRMAETMQTMAFVGFVPIIKVIIVQKCSPDEGTVIQIQMMALSILIGEHRHRKRVGVDAEIRMGYESL